MVLFEPYASFHIFSSVRVCGRLFREKLLTRLTLFSWYNYLSVILVVILGFILCGSFCYMSWYLIFLCCLRHMYVCIFSVKLR